MTAYARGAGQIDGVWLFANPVTPYYFDGRMDWLTFCNTNISYSEITNMYAYGPDGNQGP